MEINKNVQGSKNFNTQGLEMTIIRYNSARDIDVLFDNGYIAKNIRYDTFRNGSVKNPFNPEVFGVGYLGNSSCVENKLLKHSYSTWKRMMERCYSKAYSDIYITYKDCSVCEEWHDYSNFEEWYNENYYKIREEQMELDKDILTKGNKTYSPETCVFVPKLINSLFTKRGRQRGSLPIGVKEYNTCQGYKTPRYMAYWCEGCGVKNRKSGFSEPYSAFLHYKENKERIINEVAEEYKDYIPDKLYTAMKKYVVEISD